MIIDLWLWMLSSVGIVAFVVISGLVITALIYLLMQTCFEIRDAWRKRR